MGQEEEIIFLSEEHVHVLDGTYHLFSTKDSDITLDRALTLKKYWWKDADNRYDYSIQLKIVDAEHLVAVILKNDSIIAKDKIRFKLDNGHLEINRYRLLHGYILVNFFGRLHTTITLLESGSLQINHENTQLATLFILPFAGGSERCREIEFKRISPLF